MVGPVHWPCRDIQHEACTLISITPIIKKYPPNPIPMHTDPVDSDSPRCEHYFQIIKHFFILIWITQQSESSRSIAVCLQGCHCCEHNLNSIYLYNFIPAMLVWWIYRVGCVCGMGVGGHLVNGSSNQYTFFCYSGCLTVAYLETLLVETYVLVVLRCVSHVTRNPIQLTYH